jgi:hypothetical protein
LVSWLCRGFSLKQSQACHCTGHQESQ